MAKQATTKRIKNNKNYKKLNKNRTRKYRLQQNRKKADIFERIIIMNSAKQRRLRSCRFSMLMRVKLINNMRRKPTKKLKTTETMTYNEIVCWSVS